MMLASMVAGGGACDVIVLDRQGTPAQVNGGESVFISLCTHMQKHVKLCVLLFAGLFHLQPDGGSGPKR